MVWLLAAGLPASTNHHCCATLTLFPQVREIMSKLSDRRQTLLFSATLPTSLAEFAKAGLSAPQVCRVG
jgi:ATP-dependent RNA helicase DDX54/DBP10